MMAGAANPPRNGEGDHAQHGGGVAVLSAGKPLVRTARRLRRNMSLPEVLLWRVLRQRPGGFRFRRQHPQGGFVLDFACLEARLGVEVDGEAHNRGDRPARDAKRDETLGRLGFAVMRVPARDVLKDLEQVVETIVSECLCRQPLHRRAGGPPPRSGEDRTSNPPRNGEVAARSADGGVFVAKSATTHGGGAPGNPSTGCAGPPPRSGEDF